MELEGREDRVSCAICGLGNGAVLVRHHVVPKSRGGRNDPSNVVVLCRNCHWRVHRGYRELSSRFTELERQVMAEVVESLPRVEVWRVARALGRSVDAVNSALRRIALKLLEDPTVRGLIRYTVFTAEKGKRRRFL